MTDILITGPDDEQGRETTRKLAENGINAVKPRNPEGLRGFTTALAMAAPFFRGSSRNPGASTQRDLERQRAERKANAPRTEIEAWNGAVEAKKRAKKERA